MRYFIRPIIKTYEGNRPIQMLEVTAMASGQNYVMCSYVRNRDGWNMARMMRDHLNKTEKTSATNA